MTTKQTGAKRGGIEGMTEGTNKIDDQAFYVCIQIATFFVRYNSIGKKMCIQNITVGAKAVKVVRSHKYRWITII